MFSKKNRIPRIDIENIIKKGQNLDSGLFYLKFTVNNVEKPRFSVIVSKKVAKSSVKRHLFKRRFINQVKEHSFKNGDYVFFLKKEAQNKTFKEMKEDFKGFILKNKL